MDNEELLYETLDGSGAIVYRDGAGRRIAFELSTNQEIKKEESISNPIWDCGDDKFVCLSTDHSVFAVPRSRGLREGEKYQAGGAVLMVLRCFGTVSGRECSSALILSECQKFAEIDGCIPDPKASTESISQATYFIFNGNRGVMSFGTVPISRSKDEVEPEAVAIGYAAQCILKGRLGLLKASIKLAEAPR